MHKQQALIKIIGSIGLAVICVWALWNVSTMTATAENIPAPNAPQAERHSSHFTVAYIPEGGTLGDVTCHTWPANASASYEAALDIWADLLITPTIKIAIQACWADLPGTEQYTIAPVWVERYGAPEPGQDSWYPAALANMLPGDPTTGVQLRVIYNRAPDDGNWHMGTDGTPSAEEYDFVTTALRQIAQGIGFQGFMKVEDGLGKWQFSNNNPAVYDRFVVNGSGEILFLNYNNSSTSLADQLQSDNIYFDGYSSGVANGGNPVRLHAPMTWISGISYIHLHSSFHGTENGVMAPPQKGIAYHDAGPVVLGIMRDVGWGITRNTPPLITGLPDQELAMNSSIANAIDLWPYASDAEVPDDAELTFDVVGGSPLNPGVSIQNGHYLSISLQSGWLGTADITVQVADPIGATDTDVFQITAINQPPNIANIPDVIAPMNTTYTEVLDLRQYASDAEDHKSQLAFDITNSPNANAGISIVDGRFLEVDPANAYTGQTDVTIQVTDSGGETDSTDFQVQVTASNVDPIIQVHNKRVFIFSSYSIDLYDFDWDGANDYARDPEGGPITVTISNNPALYAGVSVANNRYINIKPTGTSAGSTLVQVQVEDNEGATATDEFTVRIWEYEKIYLPLITLNFNSQGGGGK